MLLKLRSLPILCMFTWHRAVKSGYIQERKIVELGNYIMFTRLVDCEMEAGKILCNIDMIDPDLCDLSAVCNVTIDSFIEMIQV